MKTILYVALPPEPDGMLQIAQERDDRLEVIHHRGPFGAASCIAFAPATSVGHFRAPIPARNEAEALRAALYAIEDELAQPVEEIHVALGPKARNSTERDIYVVDRSLMARWIDLLSHAGLSPENIIPEQCLFTDIDDPVDLGNRILQRQGNRIVAVEAALTAYTPDASRENSSAHDVEDGIYLIRLAERSAERPVVNLRTSQFALEKSRKQGASAWRKAAGIAIAAASVWTGTLILEAHNYRFAVKQLNQQAYDRYARIFPAAPRPPDIDRATRSILAGATTPDTLEFRTSVAAIYEAVAIHPGVQISALAFDRDNRQLNAILLVSAPDTVGAILAFLQSRGFAASAAEPVPGESDISTKIILEPGP